MIRRSLLLASGLSAISSTALAQYTPPDSMALEGIVVETYYISDANDAADTDGAGVPQLTAGAKTYRIFVNMKPGYILESVFGNTEHPLDLTTTTEFWNNTDRGDVTGDLIDAARLDENTVALDSWISMGAASDDHWGIPKANDIDGSIVGGANNDGGSNGVPGGLLVNNDVLIGVPLTTADGLLAGTVPAVTTIGLTLDVFNDTPGGSFATTNGAWAILGGTSGGTYDNHVLIAQLTTSGQLSFHLNMRIGIPDSLQCQSPGCHEYIDYYATIVPGDTAGGGITVENIFSNPTLTYIDQAVDCLGQAGGPALPGTACDDNDPDTGADTWSTICVCEGLLIDCENVPGGPALPGTACDDNNSSTVNDTWSAICTCEGTIGLEEAEPNDPGIALYPNPAEDRLVVSLSGMKGSVRLSMTDALGRCVMSVSMGPWSKDQLGTFDLSGLVGGVYTVVVECGDQRLVQRFEKL